MGTFERADKEGYAFAGHGFRTEPSNTKVHAFILHDYYELKFGEAKEITIQIQRMNPKKVQREMRREMFSIKQTSKPSI